MPLTSFFPRASSLSASDSDKMRSKQLAQERSASDATLNPPRETLSKLDPAAAGTKKSAYVSSRTLSELTAIPEILDASLAQRRDTLVSDFGMHKLAAKQVAASSASLRASLSSNDVHAPVSTGMFSDSADTVTNEVSKMSIDKRPSKLSFFKFLKSEKVEKLLKQDTGKAKVSPKSTSQFDKDVVAAQQAKKKSVHAVLTAAQKEERALAERERRLQEVLSVMEGRKKLPEELANYRFVNFIGDGTYGFVLTALNESGEEVAVKFIFKDKVPVSSWTRSKTLGVVPSEIHFLSLLNHPNIIRFMDCFEDADYIILVTELHGTSWDSLNPLLNEHANPGLKSEPRHVRCGSEGKGDLNTLASLSTSQREMLKPRVSCDLFECIDDRFPEYIARRIFSQVVSAVKYLHDNGIVHRDLKDENIAIDEHYNVRLLDFGSAAYIPTAARDWFDKFLGTLDFASPEIVEGYRYRGPEAEVWALGVLLYIIVFRQVPFKSTDAIKLAKLSLPSANDVHDPDYPDVRQLFDLLHLMLEPIPSERATLEEVVAHPWLQGITALP
ncbi:hypothetical protein RI367_003596 [Sorochytrium milnesiophthora]